MTQKNEISWMLLKEFQELIAFYNTENFFSPDYRSPSKGMGLSNWNTKRYKDKLFKISHVFDLMQQDFGKLPMLIGLSEIQGKSVLQDLVNESVFQSQYQFIHFESMDERGVDVALLYDSKKIEILKSEPISFFFEIDDQNPENYDTTRDVLRCKLKFGNFTFQLFVVHLPSKREDAINKPKRLHIVKKIKENIIDPLAQNIPTIICGDFNENPNDEILGILKKDEKNTLLMFNPFEDLFQNNHFSTFHQNKGLLFDQLMLSSKFLDKNNSLFFKNAGVYNSPKISNWDRKFFGKPFRTYAGSRYLGGYSDHFPIYTVLEISK